MIAVIKILRLLTNQMIEFNCIYWALAHELQSIEWEIFRSYEGKLVNKLIILYTGTNSIHYVLIVFTNEKKNNDAHNIDMLSFENCQLSDPTIVQFTTSRKSNWRTTCPSWKIYSTWASSISSECSERSNASSPSSRKRRATC